MRTNHRSSNETDEAPTLARTGKLILLRGPREPRPGSETVGSSTVRLDLQGPIDNLRLIRGDLEAYYWDRTTRGELGERERYQINLWIRLVGERTAALEGILLHTGVRAVTLTAAGPAEREAVRSASKVLDRWIHEEEPFREVLAQVAAILAAADTICLMAAGGTPERPGDSGQRRGSGAHTGPAR